MIFLHTLYIRRINLPVRGILKNRVIYFLIKMKAVYVMLAVFCSLISGCEGSRVETVSGFKQYHNPAWRIRLEAPLEWETAEDVTGSVVVFYSPVEAEGDVIQDNVNLIIEDLSETPLTLFQYSRENISQIREYLADCRILEEGESMLSGYKSGTLVFTGTQEHMDLKWYQEWTVVNDRAYLLTYTAEAGKYDKYYMEAMQIIRSLKIQ
ncbi:MAG TPA: hypothetical protein DD727_03515 [Clostridiales bacterium]|nr:hypothetical protein [Clostridiales bacterium]